MTLADDEADDEDINNSESQPSRKRAKRYSKMPYHNKGKPSQLRFYRGGWVEVLEKAKKFFRLYITKMNAWPDRDTHLKEAAACVEKAISEYNDAGEELEDARAGGAPAALGEEGAHRVYEGGRRVLAAV